MKSKKQLEIKIQQIPPHPNPKVELEQYSTPASIASDVVWNAYTLGDVYDKTVLDLGCGSGVLTIASLLLGAKSAIGVDIDKEAIDVGREYCSKFKLEGFEFLESDVNDLELDFSPDTIFQNPPFGSQRGAAKGADLKFVKKAVEIGFDVLYSFHMASTQEFLIDYYSKLGLEITHIFRYKFRIPKIYEFHTQESRDVDVIVIRAIM